MFRFLNGLNESFQGIRSHILTIQPFPSLDEVYNIVLREESQRNFSLKTQPFTESVTMAVKGGRGALACTKCNKSGHSKDQCYSDVICGHCGKQGHPKEKCFKVVGFPSKSKINKPRFVFEPRTGLVNQVTQIESDTSCTTYKDTISAPLSLSQEQIAQILQLLND